jgi:uncharacterized membrane protein
MNWAFRSRAVGALSLPWLTRHPKGRGQSPGDQAESVKASKVLSWEVLALLSLSGFFAAYWSICSLLIHRSFHSNGWDLGLIHQVVWNSAHGRLFHYSFRNITYSGDHWQPSVLLFVPLEWLTGGPEPMLVVQAVAFALAVVPLYTAARGIGCTWQQASAISLAYLLSLGVACAVSYDFHVEAFVPLLAFTALWSLVKGSGPLFLISTLAILTLKEDGALLALALCWVAWIAFAQRSFVVAAAVAAVVYMTLATYFFIPHYRGDDLNPFIERYGYLGTSPGAVLVGILMHPTVVFSHLARPETVGAICLVFTSAALLLLAVPRLWPALGIVLLLPLLSQQPEQNALELHYLVVPSTVAMVLALVAVRDRALSTGALRRFWPAALIAGTAVLYVVLSPLPPSLGSEPDRFDVGSHARLSSSFVRQVPGNAKVSAQSPFVPHLSSREYLYQFPRVLNAEYVLLDTAAPIPVRDLQDGYAACLHALPRLGFDVVRQEGSIVLWHKARPAEDVPEVPIPCSGQH